VKRTLTAILAALLILFGSGCRAVPKTAPDTISGVWKDSYGLMEYRFNPNGTMKVEALNFGSFKGTYLIQDSRITIQYKVVVKSVKETYEFRLDGDTLFLDDQEFKRKK
jgi:hypothetical protein